MRFARFGLTTAALSLAYYLLGTVVFSKLPYLPVPSLWVWPTRAAGVATWFALLNIAGALLAALPVALLVLTVRLISPKSWVALAVGAVTGVAVFLPVAFWGAPAYQQPSWILWLNNVTLFISVVFAVPLLVQLIIALPSNNRWRGP